MIVVKLEERGLAVKIMRVISKQICTRHFC